MAGYGTLTEVRRDWSIDDLMDAVECLEVKADAEVWAHQQAQKKRD